MGYVLQGQTVKLIRIEDADQNPVIVSVQQWRRGAAGGAPEMTLQTLMNGPLDLREFVIDVHQYLTIKVYQDED